MKILLCSLLLVTCHPDSDKFLFNEANPAAQKSEQSPQNQNSANMMQELKTSMTDYMKAAHPSYSEKDVDTCATILNNYKIQMANTKSKEEGMDIVKTTILKLNKLNDKCEGSLIETNEREKIAEIIILEGYKKGYNKMEEDITEQWREW